MLPALVSFCHNYFCHIAVIPILKGDWLYMHMVKVLSVGQRMCMTTKISITTEISVTTKISIITYGKVNATKAIVMDWLHTERCAYMYVVYVCSDKHLKFLTFIWQTKLFMRHQYQQSPYSLKRGYL